MKFCPNSKCPYYIEHGFVAEFEDRIEACLDCGVQLVNTQPVFEDEVTDDTLELDEPEIDSNMVILRAQLLPTEAHILRGRLEAEGIPAFVADEHISSFYLPTTFGGARLLVRECDWDRADEILGGAADGEEEAIEDLEDEDDL